MRSKTLDADTAHGDVSGQRRFALGAVALTLALAGIGALLVGCLNATSGPLGPVLIGTGPRLGILAAAVGGTLLASATRDRAFGVLPLRPRTEPFEAHRVIDLLLAALLFATGSLGLAAELPAPRSGIDIGLELLMALSGAAVFFLRLSHRT